MRAFYSNTGSQQIRGETELFDRGADVKYAIKDGMKNGLLLKRITMTLHFYVRAYNYGTTEMGISFLLDDRWEMKSVEG